MRGTRGTLALAVAIATATVGLAVGCGDGGSSGGNDLGLTDEGVLLVGADIPYPPFEGGDPPDYEGFDIDLINAVADEMGLDVEMMDVPFDVVLSGGNGRFDLAISATTIKPSREKVVDFSDPYFEAAQGLLVRSDSGITSLDDITADTVIGAEDKTTGETYALDNTDAEVRPFPEIDDAYTALANSQVDAVLNDLPSVAAAVEDNPDLEVVDTFETNELYGIVFPEDSDALREAVNKVLQTLKDNGTLAEIYDKWFGTKPPDSVLKGTNEPT